MTSLQDALAEVRELVLGPDLVRAIAAGRRRGATPSTTRATLRPVQVKSGVRLQLVTDDDGRPRTVNADVGTVDELLAEPFGNWHVETTTGTLQLRVTKKGDALVHRSAAANTAVLSHDRSKEHLLDPGDPLYDVIGGNAAKRRQVDAFLRQLDAALPESPGPLHVVDLGCGNAYLTFAAYRYLTQRGVDVRLTGVDIRADQRERNTALAEKLGWSEHVQFVAGTIADAEVSDVDVVLALHACDTATDDALARAVGWGAKWILAAPCCHKDVSRQLRSVGAPSPYGLLVADGIVRERFADVLTDALRAQILRSRGYAVEVVEFIDSAHTPRNTLLRARHTPGSSIVDDELEELLGAWRITPHLLKLLEMPGNAQSLSVLS